MGDIKYNNSDLGIKYTNLNRPQITTGFQFSSAPYKLDSDGNLLEYPEPLINATDINWGGVNIGADKINTTDELLKIIGFNGLDIEGIGVLGITSIINAIRALQAEVAKLRNSFLCGITSYKDTITKMSNTLHVYDGIEEEEPLWATDESELSIIEQLNFGDPRQYKYIINNENSSILNGENNDFYVKINGSVSWKDTDNIIGDINDPKIYLYLTVDNLSFTVNLQKVNYNEEGKINFSDLNFLSLDFSKFNIRESINGKYNILIIIGRKQLYKNNLYGDNFIWVCIADYLTSETILYGYINEYDITHPSKSSIYLLDRYQFNNVEFNNLILSKFDFYSKYSDFTNQVQESTPDDQKYKYEAAHITIRSVKNYDMLEEIKDQLLNDELIYCREDNKLYIISDNTIKNISTGGSPGDDQSGEHSSGDNDNMINIEDLKDKLIELGIINDDNELSLNDIESIKFINSETGNKFDISIDAYGNLVSQKHDDNLSLEVNINSKTEDNINKLLKGTNRVLYDASNGTESSTQGYIDVRGFVSRYNDLCANGNISKIVSKDEHELGKSWKLNADRIKIASIYAPLSTDDKISCTHAFVELENTSNKDFPLDGCYLHFDRQIYNTSGELEYVVSHLALKGYIPKNSTYLIRGKKYRDNNDANIYVKVNTFDQEWYDKETDNQLIDFTLLQEGEKTYSFALTYGLSCGNNSNLLSHDDQLMTSNDSNNLSFSTAKGTFGLKNTDFPLYYVWNFIDAVAINKANPWFIANPSGGVYKMKSNSIYKNMFELDPAKQAYNSLNKKDSSRYRYQNSSTDLQTLELNAGYVTFPHSKEYKKYVSDYTPKASFEHKNVQTDKTKLNFNKPNAVTVSFGTNVFTTRCFNWVSAGLFDEYVFLYDKDGNFNGKFESYKHVNNDNLFTAYNGNTNYPKRKEFPQNVNNVVYASLTKERIYDYFPADETYYTSHKCIINICDGDHIPTSPETWSYKIARLDGNGNIDPNYCSEEMYFTMYPSSYTPRIYQTTDQQGFHWQEYQAWAAAAKEVNKQIEKDAWNHSDTNNPSFYNRTTPTSAKIIPILINTGDMTQSGARVSEWLDYYNAGQCLFDHLEQMNVVGNNDLAPSKSVHEIGTGDDSDKSNAYFYNLFYCYEVNPIYLNTYYTNDDEIPEGKHVGDIKGQDIENPIYPIINNVYIPSLYYIDINNLRLLFLNSEITEETCNTWFKAVTSTGTICNVYTGYPTNNKNMQSSYLADELGFTTIYTMMYHMTQDTSKKYIAICHEMPFTVITRDSLYYKHQPDPINSPETVLTNIHLYRSISSADALVGCHMNQIHKNDKGCGIYWFSRLLEYRKIKLVLGGHKHTYCVTYPLAENYKYDTNKWSLIDGCMTMSETLNNDLERSVKWEWYGDNIGEDPDHVEVIGEIDTIVNHSKLPLTLVTDNEVSLRYNSNSNINDNFFIRKSTAGTGAKSEKIFIPAHIINNDWINGKHYTQQEADDYNTTNNLHDGDDGFVTTDSWKIKKHNINPVIYFMCQATGYKLTSNKELPWCTQRFSEVLPKTTIKAADNTDSPSKEQQKPMYAIFEFSNTNEVSIKLIRLINISSTINKWLFNQQESSSNDIESQYLTLNPISSSNVEDYNYGEWKTTSSYLFNNITI